MSTPSSGASRRRRIAGERRGHLSGPEPASAEPRVAGRPKPGSADAGDAGREGSRSLVLDQGARPSADEPLERPDQDEAPAEPPTGWWGSRTSLALLGVVLVLLLALVGAVALGLAGTDSVDELQEADAAGQAARTAPAAAEAAAAAILAYDYKSLDADADTASRFMTDDFAEKYTQTFEKVVRPAAQQNRAKVTATVLASATIRTTGDSARVLLFVDQATTSATSKRPKLALNRVEMLMVREGGTWLVDDISSY